MKTQYGISREQRISELKGRTIEMNQSEEYRETDQEEKREQSAGDMWCCDKRFQSCADESQKKKKREAESFSNMTEDLIHRLKKFSELTE